MILKFTKEVLNDCISTEVKRSEMRRVYKIFDQENQVIGQFFFYHKEQYLVCSSRKISVEVTAKAFKKTKHYLVEENDKFQIGSYELYNIALFPIDKLYKPYSTIQIDNHTYNFIRLSPDVQASFFKQETLGHFKFKIYPSKGTEFAEYSLAMDIPVFSRPNYTKYRPFEGVIETNIESIPVLLSAFYLMELEFDYEDNKDFG